jgi:hypothetical protein
VKPTLTRMKAFTNGSSIAPIPGLSARILVSPTWTVVA